MVLEDEISHQVRMETTLAEIAREMGLTIKVKVTGKVREFKEYVENDEWINYIFFRYWYQGEETKGLEIGKIYTSSQSLCYYCFCYNEVRICDYDLQISRYQH